jgi:endonuclease G, mitochondrial
MFVTSEIEAFDVTFVVVEPRGLAVEALADFGWLPLNPSTDKILEGEPVVIIQRPQGREKQLCLFGYSDFGVECPFDATRPR